MNILGISCYYHDAAAVLLQDGEVIAASEEERFSRKKHDSSFPGLAINFCLKEGNITAKELDYVVFYEKPFRKFHRILISSLSLFPQSYTSFREAMRIWLSQKLWIKQEIASYLNIKDTKILFSEHHISHAASAFYPSPFSRAAILTIDGVGEWATTTWGIGSKEKIAVQKEILYPQSLGLLYSAFTAFLGFEVNEGEWKVMGLAPYGKPRFSEKIWNVVAKNPDGSFCLDFSYFSFHHSDKYSFSEKLVDLLGPPIVPETSHIIDARAADIAASIQLVIEELLLHMAKKLQSETREENLCLAGGVALNSVANYRLLKESGFKNIFIQPAAGDDGGALGAALYTYHHVLNHTKRVSPPHAYLGKEYTSQEIKLFLRQQGIKYKLISTKKLIDYISDKIREGKVIGWMQGKSEWGPRALGSRSILADPRNPKMKDIVNTKVKFREAFRPFAPSVLSQKAHEIFDIPKDYVKHHPLRYMLYVVPVKKIWQKKVPAITHADNSARPQLVEKKTNPLFHQLIRAFSEKTGVPLVLNTSFNLRGEPMVVSPQDAYSTFIRSGIDILVMGNYICEKLV